MDHLRFGTYLAPSVIPAYEAITEAVGRLLGVDTELVVETNYDSFENHRNDVCFVCSLPYVIRLPCPWRLIRLHDLLQPATETRQPGASDIALCIRTFGFTIRMRN